ncbi:aminotransferase class I/II-fold pyridoxal phosphate-dependent enzyme [Promethearchaeum syntrophicum]|uniref:Aminotransferase class I/II-fold pyridoxal phosphate-dependent enzyme n=1 Tax=Promethearchaeum syntrophicum TaxID=2594042 RepID=A0A5B9DCQ1_9ARCH|nr:aminotransferase class I/II-fold pyridoxal phosphate-dependent enzyme [Candidatus Prometheoarchaeum syntrophicum]
MKREPEAFLKEEVKNLYDNHLNWVIRHLEVGSKPHSIVDGKEVLMLNTNNYLGLASHPKIIQAARDALDKYGIGAGAVPTIAGTFDLTKQFQEHFAKFKGVEASLLCQTGFAVNQGVIPQLVGKGDYVISDQLNHGSIIDGVRLTKATKGVYAHNDIGELEKVLKKADSENARRILVITDGVFSMDGDMAPLDKIADACDDYGAMVFVDDCHGEGMLGNGRGIVAHFNLQGRVHVEGGSLSKGFGVFGGTVAGSKDLCEFVTNKSRSYLLSTAHPPAIVAANNAAISVVETEPEHVKNLWINTNYFKEKLDNLGFNTGNSCTPIIPLIIGDPGPAQEMADTLFREEGIYGTPIVFPMVAKELSRIRVQMNALLTREDLDMALTAIEKVGKKLKII